MSKIIFLLAALLTITAPGVLASEPVPDQVSIGPHSEQEAALLLQEGNLAFKNGKFADSARLLRRLVARYPSHAGIARTRHTLALSLLAIGKPKEAIPYLQKVIEIWGSSADGMRARLPLARAYLQANDPRAALIAVLEIRNAPVDIRSEALLLQSQAHLELRNNLKASRAVEEASLLLKDEQASEAEWIRLTLKHRECERLPSKGPLDEAQTLAQIERRGACLQEAILIATRVLTHSTDPGWLKKTKESLTSSVDRFLKACQNPPPPAEKRNRIELKKYRAELVFRLKSLCEKQVKNIIQILSSQESMLSEDRRNEIEEWKAAIENPRP